MGIRGKRLWSSSWACFLVGPAPTRGSVSEIKVVLVVVKKFFLCLSIQGSDFEEISYGTGRPRTYVVVLVQAADII